MKKLLLIAMLVTLALFAGAQTQKGQGLWTGSASVLYNSQSYDNAPNLFTNRVVNTGLSVTRGVFIKDNWLIGGGLGFFWGRLKTSLDNRPQVDEASMTSITASLNGVVRRYWGKDKWRVFLGGGLAVNYVSQNYEGTSTNVSDENSFTISPLSQVGATYYLNNRLGLEASATSTSFPFGFSTLGIGMVIITGTGSGNSVETYAAPQTAKGRWVLGGSFALNTNGTRQNQPNAVEGRSNRVAISPSVGWFIRKNTLLGTSLPFIYSWNKSGSALSYGLTPYLKQYFTDNRLRPFVMGELAYLALRNKSDGARRTLMHTVDIGIDAGLAYLLGERFIVDASLGRVYVNRQFHPEDIGDLNVWTAGVSASLQPNFTITYVFD